METANMMKLATLEDAGTFVVNSAVFDWKWGGNASAEGFAEYLFRHFSYVNRNNYRHELRCYLVQVGENLADYDLDFVPS